MAATVRAFRYGDRMIHSDVQHRHLTQRMRSGIEEQREELSAYERARRGDLPPLVNLAGFGQYLVAARIACGVSQAELARRTRVDRTTVVKNEQRRYRGVSAERAARVLTALGLRLETRLVDPLHTSVPAEIHHRSEIDDLVVRLRGRWPAVDDELARLRAGDHRFLIKARVLDTLVTDGHEITLHPEGFIVDDAYAITAARAPVDAASANRWTINFVCECAGVIARRPLTVVLDYSTCEDAAYAMGALQLLRRFRLADVTAITAEEWFAARARGARPAC
jgi:transcriptional regulator with XRE-family HTH domain